MKIHWLHVDRLRLHKPADILDALDEAGLPTADRSHDTGR